MSIKGKLRMMFLYLPLLAGALSGVPMLPEDLEKLMNLTHEEVVCVMPSEDPEDDLLPVVEYPDDSEAEDRK